MRFEGTLVRWDDVRGIGAIESSQGGEPLFVHISALPTAGGRPRQGERYSFEIEPHPSGGKQAVRGRKLPPLGRPVLVPVGESRWTDAPPRSTPMPPAAARDRARAAPDSPVRRPPPAPIGAGWPLGTLLRGAAALTAVLLVGAMAVHAWRDPPAGARLDALPAPSAGVPGAAAVDYSTPQVTYRCDGRRRCSQMRSCNEARYFLAHCPGVQMDGDGNGIPCEQQLCGH